MEEVYSRIFFIANFYIQTHTYIHTLLISSAASASIRFRAIYHDTLALTKNNINRYMNNYSYTDLVDSYTK
jgi:hypothetical protein